VGLLDGRVAIVTGGSRGIGRAYSLGLSREGASVMVADVLDGQPVVDEISAAGGTAAAVRTDVTDVRSTEGMARATAERFGGIDVLVNNAAYYTQLKHGRFDDIDVEEWDTAFAINVRGPWLCARAVHPHMRDRGYGKIVNVSSMTVWDGTVGFPHYVATKAAVIGLTRALAREMGDDGIAVNVVTPDYTPHDPRYVEQHAPGVDELLTPRRCFKRTQVPEDMVGVVTFLASSLSDFITGQTVLVNGGRVFH
jgi:3-oxoacyl-[acyl-carrier protein] reductase